MCGACHVVGEEASWNVYEQFVMLVRVLGTSEGVCCSCWVVVDQQVRMFVGRLTEGPSLDRCWKVNECLLCLVLM